MTELYFDLDFTKLLSILGSSVDKIMVLTKPVTVLIIQKLADPINTLVSVAATTTAGTAVTAPAKKNLLCNEIAV